MKVDEIKDRSQYVRTNEMQYIIHEGTCFSTKDTDTLLTLARAAECYATGTPHPEGKQEYGGKLDRLMFNALVRKALGIAETPKEAVDRVFEENKDKFEGAEPENVGSITTTYPSVNVPTVWVEDKRDAELARLREVEKAAREWRRRRIICANLVGGFCNNQQEYFDASQAEAALLSALSIGEKEGGQ